MTPPKHELVVQDCDEAIKLDSKYVKAINRRAIALENLERYQEALRGKFIVHTLCAQGLPVFFICSDFTAATILDRFQNQATASAVERVLKALATKKAKEIMQVSTSALMQGNNPNNSCKDREPRLPSFTFISAYFSAFRPRKFSPLPVFQVSLRFPCQETIPNCRTLLPPATTPYN